MAKKTMNSFWKWLEENNYAHIPLDDEEIGPVLFAEKNVDAVRKPTKQMLIGYMMEYICDKSSEIDVMHIEPVTGDHFIDNVYDSLKKRVEELYNAS